MVRVVSIGVPVEEVLADPKVHCVLFLIIHRILNGMIILLNSVVVLT